MRAVVKRAACLSHAHRARSACALRAGRNAKLLPSACMTRSRRPSHSAVAPRNRLSGWPQPRLHLLARSPLASCFFSPQPNNTTMSGNMNPPSTPAGSKRRPGGSQASSARNASVAPATPNKRIKYIRALPRIDDCLRCAQYLSTDGKRHAGCPHALRACASCGNHADTKPRVPPLRRRSLGRHGGQLHAVSLLLATCSHASLLLFSC